MVTVIRGGGVEDLGAFTPPPPQIPPAPHIQPPTPSKREDQYGVCKNIIVTASYPDVFLSLSPFYEKEL